MTYKRKQEKAPATAVITSCWLQVQCSTAGRCLPHAAYANHAAHLLCVLCEQQHICLAASQPLHLLPQLLQPLLAALLHCC
jgi:hypothetical protein